MRYGYVPPRWNRCRGWRATNRCITRRSFLAGERQRGRPDPRTGLGTGAFEVLVRFDAFTGTTVKGGDVCKGQLKDVRVCAQAAGFSTACVQVPGSDTSSILLVLAPPSNQ